MKTKEELAEEYRAYTLHDLSIKGLNQTIENAFIAGYEKAHDWIPINEDYSNLPESYTNCVVKSDGVCPVAAIWTGEQFVCVYGGRQDLIFIPTHYKVI